MHRHIDECAFSSSRDGHERCLPGAPYSTNAKKVKVAAQQELCLGLQKAITDFTKRIT